MSKGSKRRPSQVDQKTLDENWDRAFGTKREERAFGKGREVAHSNFGGTEKPAGAGEGTSTDEGEGKSRTEPSRPGTGRALQP